MIERAFYRHSYNSSGRLAHDSGSESTFTWQEILRSNPRVIVIESPSGAGKTHFLKQLALQNPSRYIYREAVQTLENTPLTEDRVVIIDGLDELTFQNRAHKQTILEALRSRLGNSGSDLRLIVSTRLGTWTSEDSRTLAASQPQRIEHIGLAYLDNDQIRELASDLGIDDIEGFILRGPPSLCGLYPYEIELFANSHIKYTGSWLLIAKVLREASFASSARHVPSLTLEKWSLGLSRLAAAACLMERQTFTVDLCSHTPDAIQAWRLLPDWTPAEQKELFSSSLFGKKTESVYMIRGDHLRGNGLAVLLAAFWCTERLQSGIDPEDCKFWIDDDSTKRRIVPKRLRSLLGWVGSSVSSLQKAITTRTPEVWIAGGDILSLQDPRQAALQAFESFRALATESNFLPRVNDSTIHAIAAYLAPHIDGAGVSVLPLRRLYFRIRAASGTTPYEAVAFAECIFSGDGLFGVSEFHEPSAITLASLVSHMPQIDRELVFELANAMPPNLRLLLKLSALGPGPDGVAALLTENAAAFTSPARSENFVRFVMRRLVKLSHIDILRHLVSSEVLGESRHGVVPFWLERILELEERPCDITTTAQILVDILIKSHWTMHEFKRSGAYDIGANNKSPHPGKLIRNRLDQDRELRAAFWQQFLESASSKAPQLWSSDLLFITIEIKDLEWLSAEKLPLSPFRIMVEAVQAKRTSLRQASILDEPWAPYAVRILRRAGGFPRKFVPTSFSQAARLLSVPHEALAELLTADILNDYWYISYNVEKMQHRHGEALMPYILDAAGKVWRSFSEPLRESSDQTCRSSDVGLSLAAIDIESQISGLKLSPNEVGIALRLASWSDNGFPLWIAEANGFSEQASQQIKETLRGSITRIWGKESASPWILDHSRLGVLVATMGQLVGERLAERPPVCRELSLAAVWSLRALEDTGLILRIVARREHDMPEASHLWIDLLASRDLRRAEIRLLKFLDTSATRLPSSVEMILRERPNELHPLTLLRIAEFALSIKTPNVPKGTHLRACVRGLMYNRVADPRTAFEQLCTLLTARKEYWPSSTPACEPPDVGSSPAVSSPPLLPVLVPGASEVDPIPGTPEVGSSALEVWSSPRLLPGASPVLPGGVLAVVDDASVADGSPSPQPVMQPLAISASATGEEVYIEDWMRSHVLDSWASLSCRFSDEDQILELERSGEYSPRTIEDLWRLVRRHILIIKREAELGDFSPKRIFAVVEEHRGCPGGGESEARQWEILAQLWFAEQMRHIGRRFYHVGREEEVWVKQDRIDISASAGRFRVPVEMKLIDYSEAELQFSIENQLCKKYMKPDGVQYGAFLIIRTRDKSFKGDLPFADLLDRLQCFSDSLMSGTAKHISVFGIDLVVPSTPSTDVKSGKTKDNLIESNKRPLPEKKTRKPAKDAKDKKKADEAPRAGAHAKREPEV